MELSDGEFWLFLFAANLKYIILIIVVSIALRILIKSKSSKE